MSFVFQILYRSFYDKSLSRSFVRNGNGLGLTVLAVLAMLSSFLFGAKTYFFLTNATPSLVTSFAEKMPDLTIDNGVIVTQDSVFRQIPLANDMTLTVDTSLSTPPMTPPAAGLYLYKRTFAVSDTNGKVSQIPLDKIFGTKRLHLTPVSIKSFLNDFIPYARKVVPFFVTVICLPLFFFKLTLLAYLFSLFSYIPLGYFAMRVDFPERMRLAAVSIIPATLFSLCLSLFSFRFFGGMMTETLITVMYMVYFLFPVTPDTRPNPSEDI